MPILVAAGGPALLAGAGAGAGAAGGAGLSGGMLAALLGSAGLSASGPILGGLLGQSQGIKERTATNLGSSDIVSALASLSLLSRLGMSIPQEVLLQASPLQQALNRRFATPVSRESRRRILRASNQAVDAILAARAAGDTRSAEEIFLSVPMQGDERRAVLRAANEGGFASVGDLLEAEFSFRQRVPEIVGGQEQIAARNRQLQELSQQEQIAALEAGGQLDIDTLRTAERDRLLRDIELRRSDALAKASLGGFNPAGALEQLERARQDADLEALTRAVGFATGASNIATQRGQLAQGLDPTLVALGLAPNFAAQRIGQPTATTSSGGNTSAAQGVSGGLSSAGSSLGNIALLQALMKGPAVGAGG